MKELIKIMPNDYDSNIHNLVIANIEELENSTTITYISLFKKDILTKDISNEIIEQFINNLTDLNDRESSTLNISANNLKKMSRDQRLKILNKNWSIIQVV